MYRQDKIIVLSYFEIIFRGILKMFGLYAIVKHKIRPKGDGVTEISAFNKIGSVSIDQNDIFIDTDSKV